MQDELGLNIYAFEYRGYDPALGRWWQIDPKASERESPYVGMANNPTLYADPLGDTIIWANDQVTNSLRNRITGLRSDSKLLNTVFEYLENSESIINISVNDGRVDEVAKKLGLGNDKEKVGGFALSSSNEIVYRANPSDKAIAEEPFHVFQFNIYNGSRNTAEIESEAKLFDYDVVNEVNYNRGILAGAAVGGGEIGIINVDISQAKTGNKQILPGTPNQKAYYNYLNSFSNFQNSTKGPYRGPLRLQLPRAYNQIYQKLNIP